MLRGVLRLLKGVLGVVRAEAGACVVDFRGVSGWRVEFSGSALWR